MKAEKVEKISNGSIASKLGALNAAHASATALANASPNSRVGKIAAYRDANAASLTAADAADEAAATATTAQADADAAAAELLSARRKPPLMQPPTRCRLPPLPLAADPENADLADAADAATASCRDGCRPTLMRQPPAAATAAGDS